MSESARTTQRDKSAKEARAAERAGKRDMEHAPQSGPVLENGVLQSSSGGPIAQTSGQAVLPSRTRRLARSDRRQVPAVPQPPLLQDFSFRNLMLSRLLSQTAQGAIMYALLIILVDRTDMSFFTSIFVVCAIVPSLAFGLPAGIVVDALPRRPLLVTLNFLRFIFTLSLVSREPSLVGIFAAALGLWTIHQFYSPTESAAMAGLVPRERLVSAQAISNLALSAAQGLGLVILAPFLLKTAGPSSLFALCAALFIFAGLLTALLPPLNEHVAPRNQLRGANSVRTALLNGWRIARTDHVMYEVLADDILVGIGASALVVIMPLYLKGVLNTGAENTVFVFAPAALGLIAGLRLSPPIGRRMGERLVATSGLMLFAGCVAALGFIEQIRSFFNDLLLIPTDDLARTLHLPPLVLLVMFFSVPAGFASSLVSVAARSVLLARTPPSFRGQVIATQSLLQNLGALAPTLLSGVAADIFGVERVAVAIAILMAVGAIAALSFYRPLSASAQTAPPAS
jgi:MFS family permease